jgi:26S proteasome regulatory subunit T4
MDEVDAIGGRRLSQGTSADREIQRTLMELLNQLDGFDDLGKVRIICQTPTPAYKLALTLHFVPHTSLANPA